MRFVNNVAARDLPETCQFSVKIDWNKVKFGVFCLKLVNVSDGSQAATS